jgi:geranylgeranyl reductase family protein
MYDVIVAGGGPGGSAAAREAAAAGATVLLLDKAAFPRDKPCGGGVNVRAAALIPFDLSPVVERTVTGVRFSLRTRGDFTRRYSRPLTFMTQRARLDAYLVEQAVGAGATLHERDAVRAVDPDRDGVTVRTARDSYRGRVLIGADGANGIVARSAGLDGQRDLAVAFEGNIRFAGEPPDEWLSTAALDLGLIPGGYGWLFPKGDHVNIGVGGWKYTGPTLRAQLDRVTRHYGFSPTQLSGLRGHHLPVRRRGSRIVRGRVALVGDAAGLVDPLSGEGIYAALASGRAAARHALAAIDGRVDGLSSYEREIDRTLGPDLRASSQLQDLFNLAPPLYVALLRRSDLLWTLLCRIIRGEGDYAGFKRRAGPISLAIDGASWLVRHSALGRAAGRPEWHEPAVSPIR